MHKQSFASGGETRNEFFIVPGESELIRNNEIRLRFKRSSDYRSDNVKCKQWKGPGNSVVLL